ncbi:uncharacterized protein LOC133525995 [Cydia pomonella]|uniref:uncharacterized protein LOC133525995 n=1 Tax=Cydia pomonella TaxID=82600 RepID=UPI002ADD40BD|nr:uncharacterized protein LOC133525995 [Cydia pomonella]
MESNRSCCSSSVCCGAPVEKGCFVFSIINAIICMAASIGCLVFLIFNISIYFDGESRGSDLVLVHMLVGIALGSCVASALPLTFAILLVVGIRRRNKSYVLAYLRFGITVLVLSVLACLVMIGVQWGEIVMMYTLIPLGLCVIYSLILVLVYQTYRVFSERTPATHTKLLNTNDF